MSVVCFRPEPEAAGDASAKRKLEEYADCEDGSLSKKYDSYISNAKLEACTYQQSDFPV